MFIVLYKFRAVNVIGWLITIRSPGGIARDRGATLRLGGTVSGPISGGTRHFFLLTLYNFKNIPPLLRGPWLLSVVQVDLLITDIGKLKWPEALPIRKLFWWLKYRFQLLEQGKLIAQMFPIRTLFGRRLAIFPWLSFTKFICNRQRIWNVFPIDFEGGHRFNF